VAVARGYVPTNDGGFVHIIVVRGTVAVDVRVVRVADGVSVEVFLARVGDRRAVVPCVGDVGTVVSHTVVVVIAVIGVDNAIAGVVRPIVRRVVVGQWAEVAGAHDKVVCAVCVRVFTETKTLPKLPPNR